MTGTTSAACRLKFGSARMAIVISNKQTALTGVGVWVCSVQVWKKNLQIDLRPGVPGAQGSVLTCLLRVLLSAVLLSDS